MKKFAFLSLVSMAVGINFAVLTDAATNSPQSHGVVLQGQAASGLAKQCSRRSPSGSFAVAPVLGTEKSRLETAFPAFLKLHGLKVGDYYYQYAALTRGKKRLIYVNAFRMDETTRRFWQHEPVVVCDGGKSFWGVEFDVKQGKFQNLAFNGFA